MTKKRRKTNKGLPKVNFDLSLDRVLLFLISFFVFSMPLFIWPGITEYGYAKSIFFLVGVSLLLAVWGISALVRGEWKVRLPWLTFPILALIGVSLFSLINAVNGRVVIQSLVLVVFFSLFYLLLANIVKEKRDVTLILFALLLSAFFASLYGLLQYLGVMRGAHGAHGLNEIISTMGNRNYLGGFLAYLLIPSVILIVRLRSRILRAVAIILLSFNFGMAMLVNQEGTRIALIAAFIALLIGWAIFRPIAPLRKNRAWLIALLLVLVFTFLVEAPSGPLNSVVGLSADSGSWIGRIWAQSSGKTRSWDWWVGWEMFKEHPIVGVGLGNYKLNFLPYKAAFLSSPQGASYDFYIPRAAQAHNDYVQVVAELGSLGFLALLALLLAIPFSFWIRLRKNTDEFDRFDLLLLAGGIVVFLVHALVSFPAHLPASSLVLVLTLGLASSPAYGSGATRTVHLTGWPLKGATAGLLVICLGVSVIGIRDYRANLLLAQGTRQLQIGQTRLAAATLEQSVKLDFCPRQIYYYLATVKIKQGRYEEGLDDLLMCNTRFVAEEVYLTLANVAINLGETEIAQENVDLLLSTHPNPSMELQAEYLNAMIALRKGDYDRAGDLLEALIEAHPSFERAYIALGDLYRGLGMPVTARKNYEKALTLIEKALTSNQRKLSSATRMQADEYAKLRGEIDMLQQEKEAVETALRSLPTTTSP
jgi:O-antigen ligase/Tfp pilus assembly protein PilF